LKALIFILFIISFVKSNGQQSSNHFYDAANRLIKTEHSNQKKVFYYYDQDGNRTQKLITAPSICSGATAFFHAGTVDANNTYQWQVDAGSGFVNINNDAVYSGAATNTLQLTNPPTSWYGYKYRCLISGVTGQTYSNEETLKFIATWVGTNSTAWENPANWGCNKIPDENTDVFVNGGTPFKPIVSSNTAVRTLTLTSYTNLNITTGYTLTIAK
jgi:YD repeat-containing protein